MLECELLGFMILLFFQLPHGLPPFSVDLKMEVEKRFLRDPAWMPIHDTTDAFQKFLTYENISDTDSLKYLFILQSFCPVKYLRRLDLLDLIY